MTITANKIYPFKPVARMTEGLSGKKLKEVKYRSEDALEVCSCGSCTCLSPFRASEPVYLVRNSEGLAFVHLNCKDSGVGKIVEATDEQIREVLGLDSAKRKSSRRGKTEAVA